MGSENLEGAEAQAPRAFSDWLSSLAAKLVIGGFFFFAFITGGFVAGASLHDPDTCWLLSLGKFILETGQVPTFDPFSYTFSALAPDGTVNFDLLDNSSAANATAGGRRVFIPYQWLTEVFFFLSYKLAGGYGLVSLVACVLVSAFFVAPILVYRKVGSSMLVGIGMAVLACIAASFHFLARPEIMSYFFLGVWFLLFAYLRLWLEQAEPSSQPPIAILIGFPLTMLFWANMHTAYVLALVVLGAFCLISSIEKLIRKKTIGKPFAWAWLALILACGVTFINPRGASLWTYLPELFFSPINKFIVELRTLSTADLKEWTYYPFLILSAAAITLSVRAMRSWKRSGTIPDCAFFSFIMIFSSVIGAIYCRRIIPFTSVFLVCEAAWLLHQTAPAVETETGERWLNLVWRNTDLKIATLLNKPPSIAVLLALALLGVILISRQVAAPQIPQGSSAFHAPYKAISYLSKQAPEGRCLNHPQFGDMIIWYLLTDTKPLLLPDPQRLDLVERKPKVFIDTRFDMYGAPLVSDYNTMVNMFPGWKERFDRYHFNWVFLSESCPLVSELRKEGWIELYKGEGAIVLKLP